MEDNNTLKFNCGAEVENSKQCIITAFSPVEDFNKLLENGFNSAIGIPKFGFSCKNILYLLYCGFSIVLWIKFSILNNLSYINITYYLFVVYIIM